MGILAIKQSPWLAAAIARAESKAESSAESKADFLEPKREAAISLLKQQSWPTRKTEAWKYTSLYPLAEKAFTNTTASKTANVEAIAGLDCLDIVFADGILQALPEALPEGLTITAFSAADDNAQQTILQSFAVTKPERHLFGMVNDALCGDGVLIEVAAGFEISQTIRVVYQASSNSESHNRVLVRVGEKAKASIIEFTAEKQSDASFHTAFAEYQLAEQAELTHYRFAMQQGLAMAVAGCHFSLAEKAELNSTLIGFGSELSRLDVDVSHDGEFANAKINAIYLLDGNDKFDLHSTIEHAKANGTTEENVRGIVADHAQAVFNGRIHIHRDAQKTLAELNNRNLLMSRNAEINTKPELEIYADDVRCAHGATVAEIDKGAMYYLQTRGIDKATAQLMLNFGFINELVDQMPDQNLAQWLRPQLRDRFAKMEVK